MKKILKMLLGLVLGSAIGLLIGGVFYVVFSGGTFSEYFGKLSSIDGLEMFELIGLMIFWTLVSVVLQIIIHEGGHLVAGLLTGYRFVSFRVFSLTLIKKAGRLMFRRFSIGGTGGQCLMSPPNRPLDQIDTRLYNLGGVLANLLVSVVALTIFFLYDLPTWAGTWMLMMGIIGLIYALLNGLPLKIGGISNDGHNMLNLEKSPLDKRLLCQMLRTNASVQEGVQPKDLPAEYFAPTDSIDWGDGIQINWQMMVVARLENLHQWDEAWRLLHEGVGAQKVMPRVFWMEAVCEMIFVCLAKTCADKEHAEGGHIDEARALYTPAIRKYVEAYARTQSSKQRVAFAVALVMENNREEAAQILSRLKSDRQQYLLQGEVDMDIELMEWMTLNCH